MKTREEIQVLLNELRTVEKEQHHQLLKAVELGETKNVGALAYSFAVTGREVNLLEWVLQESNYQANEPK